MSFNFQILGSSSNGNSAILSTPNTKILIDVGFSGKKIEALLKSINESIENIDGIFLTHEHSDHSMGVKGLSQKAHLQFFANRDTAHSLQSKITRPINWHLFETGTSFQYKDLEITSFSIPHDAYDPVGYIFRCGERSLAWVTDLGYIPKLVQEKISQVEILILESNYDETLLNEDTKRPWSIKQRIKSRHGHLSNDAAFDFISSTDAPHWKQIYLAHLSRDCNDVERIKRLYAPLYPKNSFTIEIVNPHA
ncbi:MBL fold metallo-hydrolase [Opitutia bacterium SCGC AG-212-L18]|nr:MBL fold metallo-hydrolase [Opitutae bacterium SCGC AG-212-L18]